MALPFPIPPPCMHPAAGGRSGRVGRGSFFLWGGRRSIDIFAKPDTNERIWAEGVMAPRVNFFFGTEFRGPRAVIDAWDPLINRKPKFSWRRGAAAPSAAR